MAKRNYIPDHVMYANISSDAKMIYLELRKLAGFDGIAKGVTDETLSELQGMEEATVASCIGELYSFGIIEVTTGAKGRDIKLLV